MTTRGLKAPARPPALLRACEQTTAATGVQHSKVYVRHFADGSGACCISNPNPKPNPNPDPDPKPNSDPNPDPNPDTDTDTDPNPNPNPNPNTLSP